MHFVENCTVIYWCCFRNPMINTVDVLLLLLPALWRYCCHLQSDSGKWWTVSWFNVTLTLVTSVDVGCTQQQQQQQLSPGAWSTLMNCRHRACSSCCRRPCQHSANTLANCLDLSLRDRTNSEYKTFNKVKRTWMGRIRKWKENGSTSSEEQETQLSPRDPRDALYQLKCCSRSTVVRIPQTDRLLAWGALSATATYYSDTCI